jgi:hypothetical protein
MFRFIQLILWISTLYLSHFYSFNDYYTFSILTTLIGLWLDLGFEFKIHQRIRWQVLGTYCIVAVIVPWKSQKSIVEIMFSVIWYAVSVMHQRKLCERVNKTQHWSAHMWVLYAHSGVMTNVVCLGVNVWYFYLGTDRQKTTVESPQELIIVLKDETVI